MTVKKSDIPTAEFRDAAKNDFALEKESKFQYHQFIMLIVVIEHTLFLFKVVIEYLIEDVPEEVQHGQRTRQQIIDTFTAKKDDNDVACQMTTNQRHIRLSLKKFETILREKSRVDSETKDVSLINMAISPQGKDIDIKEKLRMSTKKMERKNSDEDWSATPRQDQKEAG